MRNRMNFHRQPYKLRHYRYVSLNDVCYNMLYDPCKINAHRYFSLLTVGYLRNDYMPAG